LSKLWQKSSYSLSKIIERFTVGEDYITDTALVLWDAFGNRAHSKMLNKIGILTDKETEDLKKGLEKIISDFFSGNFQISLEDEDVHTKIEKELTASLGDAGKKIHTARSRNDQVMLDMRLMCKDALLASFFSLTSFIKKLLAFAKEYEYVPMPGYTHMQRGMPSSLGMWASSFAEELIDLLKLFDAVYEINDMCPLGSGAGYGVSVPIDREYVSDALGFKRLQSNALYCQNSRGRIEAKIAFFLLDASGVFNKIATDLLLFTTQEFSFFKAGSDITTGSSIMPQKRNLDVMELVRGRHSKFSGILIELISVTSSLPSGYNRDMQETKRAIINAFNTFIEVCEVMEFSFDRLKPVEENLKAALSPDIFAADEAYRLVMEEGLPFREAYKKIGDNLGSLNKLDPVKTIKERSHTGSTGNLKLSLYEKNLSDYREKYKTVWKEFYDKLKDLLEF
jgi:argininosuccinate lyase